MYEVTKHTPNQLAFGQPPRSVEIPNAKFSGKIGEMDFENSNPDQDGDSANPDSGEEQDKDKISV